MDIRLLRCFVAVAEEGSIHAGVRRMCLAQPALSQGIRKLERDFGGALFLRSPTGIELTAAGTKLLVHARQIIAYLDSATHGVRKFLDGQRPVVKIGLSSGPRQGRWSCRQEQIDGAVGVACVMP
jgi:DNA-binding transcriptional LysR family regulator